MFFHAAADGWVERRKFLACFLHVIFAKAVDARKGGSEHRLDRLFFAHAENANAAGPTPHSAQFVVDFGSKRAKTR